MVPFSYGIGQPLPVARRKSAADSLSPLLARHKLHRRAMPELSASNWISGLFFSSVGFAAFTYGKRMACWSPMLCGLGLVLLPLVLTGTALLIASMVLTSTAMVFRHR